jgi:ribosomal protein S18 acetylase RimI-like enzyme
MSPIQLTLENLPDLVELSYEFYLEEGAQIRHRNLIETELREQLSGDFKCLGTIADQQLIALCLYRVESNRVFIKRLFTVSAFRGKGHARQLLEMVLQLGKPLYLHVAPDNEAAMEFYKHLGGREVFRTYEFHNSAQS